MTEQCAWPPCDRPRYVRNRSAWCSVHMGRRRTGKDMDDPVQEHGVPAADRFWTLVDVGTPDECWEWTAFRNQAGYGRFSVRTHGDRAEGFQAHRMAWALTHGRAPSGWVLHHCDNRACCNPSHLYEGDAILNSQDAVARDRYAKGDRARDRARGVRVGTSKLTEQDVRAIRARYAGGESMNALARRYPVNASTVGRIVRRKSWAHLT